MIDGIELDNSSDSCATKGCHEKPSELVFARVLDPVSMNMIMNAYEEHGNQHFFPYATIISILIADQTFMLSTIQIYFHGLILNKLKSNWPQLEIL